MLLHRGRHRPGRPSRMLRPEEPLRRLSLSVSWLRPPVESVLSLRDVIEIFFEALEDHVLIDVFTRQMAGVPEVALHGIHDGRFETGIAVTCRRPIFLQNNRD